MPRWLLARAPYIAFAIGTIGLGLAVHWRGGALPPAARDVLGDALWAAMAAWWIGAAAPAAPLKWRTAIAFAVCVAVELSQQYHSPALDALRETPVGHLVLGSDFDARDLAVYAAGVLAAAILERTACTPRLDEGSSTFLKGSMAPVIPDPKKIKSFPTEAAFAAWLRTNHARETELWLKVHKKGSGVPSVTTAQALDVALCWGWIDGLRKSFDERSFLQRYTPRRARSLWSQINRDHVARLTAAGRMTPHGQRQVDAAKTDGRWNAAYAPMRNASEATIPADLRAAIEASPRARKTFGTLGRFNLFALAFRTNNMKTPAGRARKIETLVAMLERGETIGPERQR